MAASLAIRLAWLTITPLGAEVDPDVYCRKAIWSPSGSNWASSAPATARSPSIASMSAPAHRSSNGAMASRRSAVVNTQLAAQSVAMAATRASCWRRTDSGGNTGTGINPAYMHAKKPVT
ncbi:hypothetical protein D3C71_1565380 [compost metagenome]